MQARLIPPARGSRLVCTCRLCDPPCTLAELRQMGLPQVHGDTDQAQMIRHARAEHRLPPEAFARGLARADGLGWTRRLPDGRIWLEVTFTDVAGAP